MKQRVYYLDNISCLLIFHMIYTCHIAGACGGYFPPVINFINMTLSFFMAWFFFKSGEMYKESTTREVIIKSTKRLLIPYFAFLILGLLLDAIIKCSSESSSLQLAPFIKEEIVKFLNESIIGPTAASWFLLSLFISRIFFSIIYHRIHKIPLWIVSVLFVVLGYVLFVIRTRCSVEIFLPVLKANLVIPMVYLGTMFHGLALYSLGYVLKNKQFDKTVFCIALVFFVLKYFWPSGLDFKNNYPSGTNYILSVIYELAGCIIVNNVFKKYLDFKIPLITYLGMNSMIYFLVHFPVMVTTINIFWNPFRDYELCIRFVILSSIVTISLVIADYVFRIKKIRFIVGG